MTELQNEMVKLLRDKAQVTYKDAKEALETRNWNMLDAMKYLEESGKTTKASSTYSTQKKAEEESTVTNGSKNVNFNEIWEKIKNAAKVVLDVTWKNKVIVSNQTQQLFSCPILILIILLLWKFWVTALLIVIAAFFGVSYATSGPIIGRQSVNQFLDRACMAIHNLKDRLFNR